MQFYTQQNIISICKIVLPKIPGVTENELLICPAPHTLDGVIDVVAIDCWWSTGSADLLVVGNVDTVVVIASCKRHLTSSAVDKSNGVCPS